MGCPVAIRSHNLFQGHLWVLISPCTGGSWHHRELFFTGVDVHSWSPWPSTASQWLFLSPLKEIICPPLQTPACLPTAPCHFKETGFFCVNWFFSSPFSAFLLLLQLPAVPHSAAKHCLQAKHSNYASLYPVQWHCSCQHKKIQGIHKEPLQ